MKPQKRLTGYPSIDKPWLKYYSVETVNTALPVYTIYDDGFKVFPSMIEKAISSYKAVAACCVVATSDKEHSQGKLPAAHIVLNPEFTEREEFVQEELVALCLKELPEYAQPVDFIFRDSLPLTPIGKVDYRAPEENGSKNIE